MKALSWQLIAQDGEARAGRIYTRRGVIETPVFMPVGTQATVKGVRFESLESPEMDARIILANTYHLWLRPGAEVIRACGGVHKFGTWNRAILTDSGGFQVFSLGDLRKVTEAGVEFRSHLDGRKCFLSPEVSMEVQAALGSDVVMVFDECLPGESDREVTKRSMEMTLRWARRSRDRFNELQRDGFESGRIRDESERGGEDVGAVACPRPPVQLENRKSKGETLTTRGSDFRPTFDFRVGDDGQGQATAPTSGNQALFGIIQGATHEDLRIESLERTIEIGFDGYALGGLSVGEEKQIMYDVTERIAPLMPKDKPRYMMGVGTPEDLIEGVARGIDMFDCVLPTRNARTGQALTRRGKLNVRNAKHATDTRPLDESCGCEVCKRYSRAYLRHLHIAGEMLAAMLISQHNLYFFLDTMRRVRQAIRLQNFAPFRRRFLAEYRSETED